MRFWKVGELARRTGLTVRTFHHYDQIGLLSPSHRTPSGHRLYTADDVARLQQVVSLRQLGLSLEEIREFLDRPGASPLAVVELHLARAREGLKLQRQLCATLERIAARLRSAEGVSVEDLTRTIEVIKMHEKYFTPEQREKIQAQAAEVGEERIRQGEADWAELIAQVRAEMEKGTDPSDERVQALARRWMGLVQEFTRGDPGIERAVGTMWQQETEIHRIETAPMREMMAYVSQAMAAGGG